DLIRGGTMVRHSMVRPSTLRRVAGAALAASRLSLAFAADGQEKMVIKASDVHPPGYPNIVAMENMGKKLEKETNGRLTMQMYHSMQLGGEKEMIEQAQVGALQIARVTVGTLGPAVDDLNVSHMPFTV